MGVKVKLWKGQRGVYGIFINHHGQRKAKKVGDKKAAETVATAIRAELAKGTFRLPHAGMGFAAMAEEWLSTYPLTHKLGANTVENYTSVVRAHLIPHFKDTPVGDLDYRRVEAFVAAKRQPGGSVRFNDRPLADSSLSIALGALRMILDRAVRDGLLPANPVVRVAKFRRSEEGAVEPFTPEELRAILATAMANNRPFATFLRLWAQTGMRKGEVSALQNQDLDLAKGTLHVRRTWTRERLGPPKTRRTRVVSFLHPITENTAEWRPGVTQESRRILAELRALPVQSIDPEAFVFGVKAPWSASYVLAQWRKVLRNAGIRYRPPEQLRHTLASTLLSRNAPLIYVQKQGGWASASVLLRVYARYLDQGEQAAQAHPDATQAQPLKPAVGSEDEVSPGEVSGTGDGQAARAYLRMLSDLAPSIEWSPHDMYAKTLQGTKAEDAVAWATGELKRIYSA